MRDIQRPRTAPISVSDRTTEVNHTGSWKYTRPEYHDRVAPCREACPVGVDVEGYLTLLREGRIDEACDLLLREHPMPAITGRVCDHPCETRCNRDGFDEAVAIHSIERVLGDRILACTEPAVPERTCTETVAVIGSGPAGLACAYHLARSGYGVDVYERDAQPGGMLRQGIPAYRLPRDVLDRQVGWLQSLGIVFHCDSGVGTDVPWKDVAKSHAAIFMGVGAQRGRKLGVPGEELKGVRQGLDFLRAVNTGRRPKLPPKARVVVIGGGNTAMDCARTALRLAGKGSTVTVLYRRTKDEMPAIREEIADAEREGVKVSFLVAPASIARRQEMLSVECSRMRLGDPDASGRRRPIPTGEKPLRVSADLVLLAIGEDVTIDGFPLRLDQDGSLHADEWGATGEAAIFGGGDVTGEERTVAGALGAGKRAAIGIDRHLRRRRGDTVPSMSLDELRVGNGVPSVTRWRNDDPVLRVAPVNTVVGRDEIGFVQFARIARHTDAYRHGQILRSAQDDKPGARFAEVNLGLAADEALAEAQRCLQCGVCNQCELCLIYCSDVAISRASNGGRFDIDLEYCKGCGVCAAECPRGAIMMVREGDA